MEIFVGTSGWSNPIWNPDGLSWYVKNSGLNAVELSMPFYHLPTIDQVKTWRAEGEKLLWSIKVNRFITHLYRFNESAEKRMHEFLELFAPLDDITSYYLFQLPPNAHPTMKPQMEKFFSKFNFKNRIALEWKNQTWFTDDNIKWAKDLGIHVVSADAPMIPRDIICSLDTIYLRLHGRSDWFEHHYSRKELNKISQKIKATKSKRIVAFLNNQTSQLKNAQTFLYTLSEMNKENSNE